MSSVNEELVVRAELAAAEAEAIEERVTIMYNEIMTEDLASIQSSKEAIRLAINEKGVVVDETTEFSEYADKIAEIQTGSGGGGGGGATAYYECEWCDYYIPAIPATPKGITVSGFTYPEDFLGHYTEVGSSTNMLDRKWKNSKNKWIKALGSYWMMTTENDTATDPWSGSASFYAYQDGNKGPWELTWNIGMTSCDGSVKMTYVVEDIPEVPAHQGSSAWRGKEWLLSTDDSGLPIYTKSGTSVSLNWKGTEPVIGKSYSADTTIGVSYLRQLPGAAPFGVPTDGLVSWYSFDGTAVDAITGVSAQLVGDIDLSNGYAAGFNRTSYIKIPSSGITSSDWTVGFIMQKPYRASQYDLCEENDRLSFNDGGTSWYYIRSNGSEWKGIGGNEKYPQFNNWVFCAISNSQSTGKAFCWWMGAKNGDTFSSKDVIPSGAFYVGNKVSYGSVESYYANCSLNKIKHVFFYNKALSENEMTDLYGALNSVGEFKAPPAETVPAGAVFRVVDHANPAVNGFYTKTADTASLTGQSVKYTNGTCTWSYNESNYNWICRDASGTGVSETGSGMGGDGPWGSSYFNYGECIIIKL